MSNINLLPWRDEVKTKQKREFWIGLASAAAITLVALLGVQGYYTNLQDKQTARNQFLEKEIAILDHQIGEIRKIKEQKKSLKERIALIQTLQESRNVPTRIFNNLPLIAPTGIYLDSLAFRDSAINLDGKSEANYRVASLMRNIEQKVWLGSPSIRSIVALPGKQADMELSKFQLNFAVKLGVPEEKKEAK
ncbi:MULTISPECIES: PilN domain-containing protein [unclassified Agarivorans]|uniref:PilN domain-containing protein n=1 Tax=unclassified Agarivorans TaxID=2636026 RepID=UPI0010DEB599|nr:MULTISPECIES: PilN domain-containing protein [unclassified Agarivorans]MDO6686797.1 PilN domain-containing protein [Agarivorans sp. 3_MG-2023]MDO6716473.1 PilN domain-containing protein [Agarivorans sp. 2_MG-2023]MDO6765444.1 PilN domain-containing protein [Agarivorans sp. 1_MG-2023]GDY26744.1 fimbrial protein [Agarivorans sp. Toyoura001]